MCLRTKGWRKGEKNNKGGEERFRRVRDARGRETRHKHVEKKSNTNRLTDRQTARIQIVFKSSQVVGARQ